MPSFILLAFWREEVDNFFKSATEKNQIEKGGIDRGSVGESMFAILNTLFQQDFMQIDDWEKKKTSGENES